MDGIKPGRSVVAARLPLLGSATIYMSGEVFTKATAMIAAEDGTPALSRRGT
jgi:hypothetical protein